jgi:hypothetical protein
MLKPAGTVEELSDMNNFTDRQQEIDRDESNDDAVSHLPRLRLTKTDSQPFAYAEEVVTDVRNFPTPSSEFDLYLECSYCLKCVY